MRDRHQDFDVASRRRLWTVFIDLVDPVTLALARMRAEQLRQEEPFPGYVHPSHGTIRPQRLPASGWYSGELEHEASCLVRLSRACEEAAHAFLGNDVTAAERYFLFYPPYTLMHRHRDPAPDDEHWRIGVVVTQHCRGGQLILDGTAVPLAEGDGYLFKACTVEHEVTSVTWGHRLVWTMAFYRLRSS